MTKQRKGRGKAQATLQLIDAARTILKEIQPATVRAVCYRLFIENLIASMGKNETGKVSKHLVWARENDVIPWSWIVDETREAERINAWDSPEQVLRATINQYRKDYWRDQDCRVEVWSEKGTVRGTVAPVLEEYGVTFRVMHGFASATSLYDIAQESVSSDKPLFVLYVGDWDCSGLHMSEVDIPARLEKYGGQAFIERLALTEEDCADLPSFPAKKTDSRYTWFTQRYGRECWELDALSPVILRNRLADRICDFIDWHKWERAVEVEAVEIASMKRHFSTIQSILSPDAKCSREVSE